MTKKPFRIIGSINGNPVFLRSFPTYVEIACNGQTWQFDNYECAMNYLQSIAKRSNFGERRKHDFVTGSTCKTKQRS